VAEVFVEYRSVLRGNDGSAWDVRICGKEADDGLWDGWIEFDPVGGGNALRSRRETRQPNRADLEYWATGVSVAYLEGAFERATHPLPQPAPPRTASPEFDGPADPTHPPPPRRTPSASAHALLDPFKVYAQGEQVLHDELGALGEDHLRNIILEHELADPASVDLHAMSRRGLSELILAAVRRRSG
jgi:hypothetical protein